MGEYCDTVMSHFLNPRNIGELPDPDGAGQAGDPACGDAVRITIAVNGDRISDARFVVFGCPAAIALGSAVTELAKGQTLEKARAITDTDAASYLGGLPEVKLHCSGLAVSALHAAVDDCLARRERSRCV